MADINKSELEKNGIKLGEVDFNNYMNVYAGTFTYYLYNNMVYMHSHHANRVCYTGKDNYISVEFDKNSIKELLESGLNDYYKHYVGITEEIFDNIKKYAQSIQTK